MSFHHRAAPLLLASLFAWTCAGCGSSASDPEPDAAPRRADAATESPDAEPAPDAAAATCDIGQAVNVDAADNVNLFGEVIHFGEGRELAAGTYEVRYIDGCMKYSSSQWWAIHARSSGANSWWMVGATAADRLFLLPGTVGFLPGTGGEPSTGDVQGDRNGFEQFEDCVTANAALPAMTFEHSGGPLGIYLADAPYSDNVAGEDGRNPTWQLTALTPCE